MKFADEFRDPERAKALLAQISETLQRTPKPAPTEPEPPDPAKREETTAAIEPQIPEEDE